MPGPFPYLPGFGPTQAPACRLRVTWNGRSEEIDALIDSGASNTTIPEVIAKILNLRKVGEELVGGAVTSQREMRNLYVTNLDFLGLNFPSHPVFGLPKDYALIGRDILNLYITTLHGPNQQYSLNYQ
ncbi:MAG: retroviral-like aspartic protease family protein [Nitrospinae bacterium]|nr:retroviral-like aspartic protease family protein [Nitrospinota bacterium]